jgi:hypothetical protein
MNGYHVTVTGARGGHGATTVAIVIALYVARQCRTTLVSHDLDSAAALAGVAVGHDDHLAAIAEGLTLADRLRQGEYIIEERPALSVDNIDRADVDCCLAVLRGPCYLALRTLAGTVTQIDGIVLLAEPGRCLGTRDVEDVVGAPVISEVPVTERVARTIDAGILVARFAHLREFLPLARYVDHIDIPSPNTVIASSPAA